MRKVLNNESVPELPAEIDAAANPLAVESTRLVGAYTADLHHHERTPDPEYSGQQVADDLAGSTTPAGRPS